MSTFFKLIPAATWLDEAADPLVTSEFLEEFGPPTPDMLVPNLNYTFDVDHAIGERPTEVTAGVVSMIQLLMGRWFQEDVAAVHVDGTWWGSEESVGWRPNRPPPTH